MAKLVGYQIFAEPGACIYCIALASRGPVYKSEDTAAESVHAYCKCTIAPVFEGDGWAKKARQDAWQQYHDHVYGVDADGVAVVKKVGRRKPAYREYVPPKPLPESYLKNSLNDATALERESLHVYTTEQGERINGLLRAKSALPGADADSVRDIDSALQRNRLPQDTRVYRGSSAEWAGLTPADLEDRLSAIGRPIKLDGYTSTTVNPNMSAKPKFGSIDYEIIAPKGTPAAYVADISRYPEEEELLLGRGLTGKIIQVILDGERPLVMIALDTPGG